MAPRRSFTREFKLESVRWYYENGKNINKTSNHFTVDRKRIRDWIKSEDSIRQSKNGSRSNRIGRVKYPLLEKELYKQFIEMRDTGKRVKRWWFNSKAKTMISEFYPDDDGEFKMSDRWFQGFCRRYRISFRRKTHAAQKSPSELRQKIEEFHASVIRERKRGTYSLRDLANMDQTPLPFVLDDNKTYDKVGAKEVWIASGQSGLEKRQCTVQLTVFADGSTLPPLIIFRGKGLRIQPDEKKKWDKRVKVMFQPSAWCDENIMKRWIQEDWNNMFLNPPTPGSTGKMLFADVHPAQQTDGVKVLLSRCKTKLKNIPGGTTSRIQVLDVVINKPFKNNVREQFEEHMDQNLDLYVEGKLSVSERRILTTKWVANAWQHIKEQKEMIKDGFLKCRLSNSLDGSYDEFLNVNGIEDYVFPSKNGQEFELIDIDSDEEQDEDDEVFVAEESFD